MLFSRNSNQNSTLLGVTTAYLAHNWSVIPLTGKIAAISWKPFQENLPAQTDLQNWFADGQYTSIGIVTGRVSQLLVLDFDREGLAFAFAAAYQDLTETYWVRTKRGFHLYFTVPANVEPDLRTVRGVDVQWEGRYVVAAGSQVSDHVYTIVRDAEPKTLTQADLTRIADFLAEQVNTPIKPQKRLETAAESHSDDLSKHPTPQNLLMGMKTHLAHCALAQGRNDTLFKLACVARDHGCTQDQVSQALVETYAHLPTPIGHAHESPDKRRRQAQRTIASAFSRPPRPIRHREQPVGLSNQLREAMFSRKWTYLVRTLEGLRLKGIQPGDVISKAQAVEMLSGVVGRDSVHNALNTVLDDGTSVFERTQIPPGTPPKELANHLGQKTDIKCIVSTTKNPVLSAGLSRPTAYFAMPSNDELAAKFDVETSYLSDELTLDDLSTAKSTRQAYHSRFIRRRPGQYRLDFLGKRLGTTARTMQNYHEQIPAIQIEPMYSFTPVYWYNLDAIIPDEYPPGGVFLADETGKRYPALRPIARKLLAQGHKLTLRRREANYYWYLEDDGKPLFQQLAEHQPPPQRQYWPRTWETPAQSVDIAASTSPMQSPIPVSAPQQEGGNVHFEPNSPIGIENELSTEQAQLARRLFTQINQMGDDNPDHQLTLGSAQRIVTQYGVAAVKRALWIVQQRNNVRKPVGLLCTILRSEFKANNVS